jgi:hypothetical protein
MLTDSVLLLLLEAAGPMEELVLASGAGRKSIEVAGKGHER